MKIMEMKIKKLATLMLLMKPSLLKNKQLLIQIFLLKILMMVISNSKIQVKMKH